MSGYPTNRELRQPDRVQCTKLPQYSRQLLSPSNRPIFHRMRRCATHAFLALFLVWGFLGTRLLRAQTPSGSGSCSLSSEEPDNESVAKVHPKVIVDGLIFDGSIHLLYSELEPAVEKFNQIGRSLDSPWLDEFLETSIRSAWQDRGYFKVLVSGRSEPQGSDAAHQHFSVILHVDEGPQYRLGSIRFRAEHSNFVTYSEDRPTLRKRHEDGDPDPPDAPAFPIDELRSIIPLSIRFQKGCDSYFLYGCSGAFS